MRLLLTLVQKLYTKKIFDRLLIMRYSILNTKIFYERAMAKQYSNFTDITTFSRASTATYRASNGYIASAAVDSSRIDYDAAGNLQGILLEPQRTNLLSYSNDFSTWNKTEVTAISNSVSSPDNSTNASAIFETTANTSHFIQDFNIITDTTADHCFSLFIKPGLRDSFSLQVFDSNTSNSFYIVYANEEITSNASLGTASYIDSGIITYPNGWKRIWVSGTPSSTNSGSLYSVRVRLTGNYAGDDSVPAIYAWGAQLELGRYPSSLIYTDGAQATRALDYLSIPVDGFSYSSNSGTVVMEVSNDDYQRYNNRLVSIGNSSSEGLDLWYTPASQITVWNDEDNVRITDYVDVNRNEYHRVAISYSANSNVGGLAVNGNTYTYSANVPSIPSVSSIDVNHEGTNNGTSGVTHIKRLDYYPRALSLEYIGELTR